VIATTWYAVVFFGMCVIGFAGRLLLDGLDNPEQVFFAVNSALFPSVIGAILLAAVLSAIMSTADSMLLVTATTVAHDLGVNKLGSLGVLMISRLTIVGISILAMVVAVYLPATIFERVLFAWVAIGSSLGPVIVCRALGLTLSPGRIFPAILAGFLSAVILYLLPNTPGDIAERSLPFLLGLVILLLPRPGTAEKDQSQA
jgi:Na+/proline symporter